MKANDYIESKHLSNRRLRKIVNLWIGEKDIDKERKIDKLYVKIEKLKDKISRPSHRALIKASKLNKFVDKVRGYALRGVEFYSPNDFIKYYRIGDVCEGCKREPIQEMAHIVAKRSSSKFGHLNNFVLSHYANIMFLCGTCHNIVDGRGLVRATKRKEDIIFRNILKSREKIHEKFNENLIVGRSIIKKVNTRLGKIISIAKRDRKKATKETLKLMRENF